VNDAVIEIDAAGLKPRIEIEDDLTGAPDKVAEQDPPAGAKAKKGDTVTLVLPAGSTDTSVTTSPTTEVATTEPATTTPATTPTTKAPATTAATAPPTSPPTTVTVTVTTA